MKEEASHSADGAEAHVPSAEIEARVAAFQDRLAEAGLAAALVVEATDLYYLSGTMQDAHLLVPVGASPTLLVRKSLSRAEIESPLSHVRSLSSLRDLPEMLARSGISHGRLGVEFDVLPAVRLAYYEELLAPLILADCSEILRSIRARKSRWELARIEAASRMLDVVFAKAPGLLHEGVAEIDVMVALEHELRRSGHDGYIRSRGLNQEMHYGFVLAGASAATPGGSDAAIVGSGLNPAVAKGSTNRRIRAGEPIVVDLVGSWQGYLADATRTFAIGHVDESWYEAYDKAVTILDSVVKAAKPGVTGEDLYTLAVDLANDQEGFMGIDSVRFVGHGLGLQINEPPFLAARHDEPLEVGHVFALEPKFVVEGRGAVGIENTYVVEDNGLRQLTTAPDLFGCP